MTDDIDDEFRRIVASQLADLDTESIDDLELSEPPRPESRDAPVAAPRDEPPVPHDPPVRPAPPATVAPPVGTPRSWTPAPEPDDFVPPPLLPPAKRPSAVAWAAISSIGAGVVLLGGVVLSWLAGSWATPVGFLMLCSGLVVLFTRLPRDRDPGPDNGAKV